MTRRESIGVMAAASAARAEQLDSSLIKRHDEAIGNYLRNQVTDPASRWRGGIPDVYGLHAPGSGVGVWEAFTAGFICPQSRFYKSGELIDRIKLAADFVDRSSSPEGNIYLPITNFNSPPDSAFATRSAATTVLIARKAKAQEILQIVEPRLKRLASAITTGGIHTPNHRWVVCAALSQVHELWPDPAYMRRIDQWLAEGIDMDSDGQWSERSAGGYNAICDSAYTAIADKLKRPELLEPVRRNLESMLYLLHADGEVETGFSRRQDLNTRVTMNPYWFPIQYLAVKTGDRRFGQLAKSLFPTAASLSTLQAYPELNRTDIAGDPVPDNYVKEFPHNHVLRIRRGLASTTVETQGRDRFLSVRYGDAVIQAIRFASAFFGKAQFIPQEFNRDGKGVTMTQQIQAPYYQPFTPTRKINADEWDSTQKQRPQTQICHLTQSATVRELANGIALDIDAHGTDNVPVSIELNIREGVKIEGATDHLLTAEKVRLSGATNQITITGAGCEHKYTDIRGALPRLPGKSVYITGFTPFKRTIEFTWS